MDEDERGLGRRVSKMVRITRTMATKWAEDGKGKGNNNA
jgi:hypothetical protein